MCRTLRSQVRIYTSLFRRIPSNLLSYLHTYPFNPVYFRICSSLCLCVCHPPSPQSIYSSLCMYARIYTSRCVYPCTTLQTYSPIHASLHFSVVSMLFWKSPYYASLKRIHPLVVLLYILLISLEH